MTARFTLPGVLSFPAVWPGRLTTQPACFLTQHRPHMYWTHVCFAVLLLTVMKHRDQSTSGRKVLVQLTLPHHCSSLKEVRRQGRILEAGANAKAVEGAAYWLVLHGLLSLPSYTRITHPGMAPPAMGWVLPHQSLVRKCSTALPTPWSYRGTASTEAPSSLMTPVCVKLT